MQEKIQTLQSPVIYDFLVILAHPNLVLKKIKLIKRLSFGKRWQFAMKLSLASNTEKSLFLIDCGT